VVQLNDSVRRFLEEKRFAVMATVGPSGMPQQTVMWYALRDGIVVMNTAAGRVKANNLERDRRVSLCVEDGYRYVTITGRAVLNHDQEQAQADIAALAVRYHGEEKARDQIAAFRRQHRVSIYLSIDSVVADGFGSGS
jgi:PPOX class probable F420-dependent enzyme